MPVERRGQVTDESGPTGNRKEPSFLDGRRRSSFGGTSRMMREYHVRICERLGAKLPGPTRQRCGNAGTRFSAGTVERGERKRTADEVSKAD